MAHGRRLVVKNPADPGEAEDAVVRVRGHLREAQRFEKRGQERQAHRAKQEAKKGIAAIAAMLEGRFVKNAWKTFGGTRRDLVDDAVSQMFERLTKDLMDLRPEQGIYERRFNCRVMYLVLDVLDDVARKGGMRPIKKRPPEEDEPPDEAEMIRSKNGTPTPPEELEDDAAQRDLGWFVGEDLKERLLARLPTAQHRRIFLLRMAGTKWKDVVRKTGVPDKTARRCFDGSKEILRQELLAQR